MLRHIILTQGRSGSNFLANTLNLHPAVVNFGEVLGEWTVANKLRRIMAMAGYSDKDFLETLYRNQGVFYSAQIWSAIAHLRKKEAINFKHRLNIKTIGIKEFCFNFQRFQLENFLTENSDIAIIHLHRKNLLHRCLSLESLKTHKIVATKKQSTQGKMYIDPKKVLIQLKQLDKEAEYEHKLVQSLNKNPILELSYEEFFATPSSLKAMTNKVFDFLGVSPIEIISDQRKILAQSLNEIIENYDEICTALKNTNYVQYLDRD